MEPTDPNTPNLNQSEAPAPAAPASAPVTPENQPVEPAPATTPTAAPATPQVPDPAASAPVIPSDPSSAVPASAGPVVVNHAQPTGQPHHRKRWLLPLIVAVILVLAAEYVFGIYLPNRPAAVYKSGLKNSGKAVDKLVDYATSQSKAKYESYAFNGSANVKTSDGSFDLNLNGAFDKDANGTLTAKADVMGQNITANVRSVHAKGNSTPDIYLQVGGIKQYLDSAGLNSLDNLDSKWIAIDHTLLDTYASALQHTNTKQPAAPTPDQYNDVLVRVQTVNKKYLFTTDSSTAVLQDEQYVGKETKDGHSTYHYTVGYNKAHLQAYVNALKPALDGSKLNAWSKQANGKNLSQEIDIDSLSQAVKNAKSGYRFDLWVDAKTRLIHSLQFTDPSNKSSVLTIIQNYTSGNTYPFLISFSDKDATGTPEKGQFSLEVNTDTNVYTGTLSVTTGKNGSDTEQGSFTLKPSNDPVHVTAPSNSEPVTTVLNQLGLGFLAPSTATPSNSPANDNLFTLSQ